MVELKSIEHTATPGPTAGRGGGTETAKARITKGSRGSAPSERSRATALLGTGQRKETLRRPRSALESVIGDDDRQRILETELFPWRMICALHIKSPLGAFVGTGWLAGPRTVITAGHCIYHLADMGGYATEIEVAPGRNEDKTPHNKAVSSRFSVIDRWVEAHDPDFDVGCIHLDAPLGDAVGWFRTATMPEDELKGWLVNISGYPGDKPFRFDENAGKQQFFHKNRVLHVSERRVFYDVDTAGGQSGAPVWIQNKEDGDPIVVAIHAYGVGGTPSAFNITANSAPRIIPELYAVIEGWIAKSGGVA